MALEEYKRKRRFEETPEPKGAVRKAAGAPRFVVQEHHARSFHHDLRLEMDGVLKSWAVPKGVSMNPDDKRLAVLVEDHPLEYGDFEGIIPEGNYGAGRVMVWDRGTYHSLDKDPAEGFRKGKLTFVLDGEKLKGEFHLIKTRMSGRGGSKEGQQWLLFKRRDQDAITGWTLPKVSRSAASGRTIEEIGKEESARWAASHDDRPPAPSIPKEAARLGLDKRGQDPFPAHVTPMLAKLIEKPFDHPDWLFEIKWDGVRAVALMRRDGPRQEVVLESRNLNQVNRQYPEIVEALYSLNVPDIVLDGEIVAVDAQGRPSFQLLQQRINLQRADEISQLRGRIPLLYYVFDILYYNGHNFMARPLSERRAILEAVVPSGDVIRISGAYPEKGTAFYRAAGEQQLEGIVGKRRSSTYEPGRRSGAWVKIKVVKTLNAVVGGYTRGRRSRQSKFGALLVGLYDSADRLQYSGHVGGGFTEQALDQMLTLLKPLERKTSPFTVTPPTNEPATWVKPELVVKVEYIEWTEEGVLRAPVFKGLEPDLPPHECRLEDARPARVPAEVRANPSPSERKRTRPQAARAARQDELTPLEREVRRLRIPLEFTNLDKVYWPELGLTKGDLITYYLNVHEAILPHLKDRPLSLRRFPDGIYGEGFYQKDYPDAPPFVQIARIWTSTTKTTNATPVCNNLATLLWLGQIGCIETHSWYSRITPMKRGEGPRGFRPSTDFSSSAEARDTSVLNYPDFLVFDIDPYIFPPGTSPRKPGRGAGRKADETDPEYTQKGFEASVDAAMALREVLEKLDLKLFVKTTGKTGMHIYVPIARRHTYGETHAFAKTICQFLEAQHPDRFTTEWAVEKRVGKVFLDYNMNRLEGTLAGPYSLRPTVQATVSTPVTWQELERGIDPLAFTYASVPERLKRKGDPWEGILLEAQSLDEALKSTRVMS